MTTPFTEFREDGWPLCPRCGEDELWSNIPVVEQLAVNDLAPEEKQAAYLKHSLRCYACNWSRKAEAEAHV